MSEERGGSVLSFAGSQKQEHFCLCKFATVLSLPQALHLLQEDCQSTLELLDLTCGWLLTFRIWEAGSMVKRDVGIH